MRPIALAGDTTAIVIPDEFRDLLLLEIKSKMDLKLNGYEASQITAVNYQKKLQELLQGYQNKMQATRQERMNLTKEQ